MKLYCNYSTNEDGRSIRLCVRVYGVNFGDVSIALDLSTNDWFVAKLA